MKEKRVITFARLKKNCDHLCNNSYCENEKHPDSKMFDPGGRCRESKCPIWRRLVRLPGFQNAFDELGKQFYKFGKLAGAHAAAVIKEVENVVKL